MLQTEDSVRLSVQCPRMAKRPWPTSTAADTAALIMPDLEHEEFPSNRALPSPVEPGSRRLSFGLAALDRLARRKSPVGATLVEVTAIADSEAEEAGAEAACAGWRLPGFASFWTFALRPVI